MRSRTIWVVASAAAVSLLTACSGDDSEPTTTGLPSLPGAAGSSGMAMGPAMQPAPATAGNGNSSEGATPPARAMGDNGVAAGSNGVPDAGAAADGGAAPASADAGVAPSRDAGATPPGNDPPPGNDAVGFSDVFQLLLDNCGNCHGANAPGNRPRFAQAGNQAASFTATQATSPNGGPVSARIIARAVTTRDMPPACGRAALGTGACLDAAEAALLQTWITQGAGP